MKIDFYKLFFIFQLQAQLQSKVAQSDPNANESREAEDDIDAALTDLQITLEGTSTNNTSDIMDVPELSDYLRYFRLVC